MELCDCICNFFFLLRNIVYWLCRGIDHEPVRPRQLAQSVGCSKNFRGKLTLRTKDDVSNSFS